MPTGTETNNELMISIIIPVYKVESYVEACLDSIAAQSCEENYEVILVDDCSPDRSAKVCRKWISRNPGNFRLLKNDQNMGVSAARNLGLETATGKYFMFVDPDDLLPSGALAELFDHAEKHRVDIVKGNNTIFDETQENGARYNVTRTSIVKNDAVLTTLLEHSSVRGHPWGKLFLRERLGHFRFPVGVRMAQDLFYCGAVFAHARSLLLLDKNVYRYRNRTSGSTGGKFESGSYLDWLKAVEDIAQFAHQPDQLRAHKELLVRTMTQLARECRNLPPALAQETLSVVEQRCDKWQIKLPWLIIRDKLGPRSLSRYLKMRLAIRETKSALKHS